MTDGAEGADWSQACRQAAAQLATHAMLAVAVVVAGFAVLMHEPDATLERGAAILAAVFGAAVVAAAAHAGLDAWLFRLMASHGDEESGGAAVDRLLTRLRLAPARDHVRPAAARIAGAQGVLRRLWLALAAFVAAMALAVLPSAASLIASGLASAPTAFGGPPRRGGGSGRSSGWER